MHAHRQIVARELRGADQQQKYPRERQSPPGRGARAGQHHNQRHRQQREHRQQPREQRVISAGGAMLRTAATRKNTSTSAPSNRTSPVPPGGSRSAPNGEPPPESDAKKRPPLPNANTPNTTPRIPTSRPSPAPHEARRGEQRRAAEERRTLDRVAHEIDRASEVAHDAVGQQRDEQQDRLRHQRKPFTGDDAPRIELREQEQIDGA